MAALKVVVLFVLPLLSASFLYPFNARASATTSPRAVKKSPSPLFAQTLNELSTTLPLLPDPQTSADLCFTLAVRSESDGNFRSALSLFHSCATLYACRLEHPTSFSYVTNHNETVTKSILAYACVRLAHLNHDALGDSLAATRLYHDAIEIDDHPSSVSYDGLGSAIEASGLGPAHALPHYEKAYELSPGAGNSAFHLGVALERVGRDREAQVIFDKLRLEGGVGSNSLVDSWGYVRWHMRREEDINLFRGELPLRRLRLFLFSSSSSTSFFLFFFTFVSFLSGHPLTPRRAIGTRDMIALALNCASNGIKSGGLICEFGVSKGRSMRMLTELLPKDRSMYGFDTFTGLPQAWGDEPAGSYSTNGVIPQFPPNVSLRIGLFEDTIEKFLKEKEVSKLPLAFANIDCDLYTSTTHVLASMQSRIVPGTVLIFDEYICHPTWRNDEFRSFRESCKRFGWNYEYIAFSLTSKQAIVRILD